MSSSDTYTYNTIGNTPYPKQVDLETCRHFNSIEAALQEAADGAYIYVVTVRRLGRARVILEEA